MKLGFFGIDQLNFVEFNITGDDSNYQKLSEESKYLGSEVFNLFAHCFEKSNDLYEYYEPTKFNSRKIIVLRNELVKNLFNLNKIDKQEIFSNFINNIFLGKAFLSEIEKSDIHWQKNWEEYLNKLKLLNKEMINIIDKCVEDGRVFWIIGY
jgi:hypothetical protein